MKKVGSERFFIVFYNIFNGFSSLVGGGNIPIQTDGEFPSAQQILSLIHKAFYDGKLPAGLVPGINNVIEVSEKELAQWTAPVPKEDPVKDSEVPASGPVDFVENCESEEKKETVYKEMYPKE